MKVIKKAACAVLAAALAISALAGCGVNRSGVENLPSGEASIPGEAAKGRYIETEMELPEVLQDSSLINFTKEEDGTMNLFARTTDIYENIVYIYYSFDGSKWTENTDWWGMDLIELGLSPSHIAYGADGFYYAGCRDTDYIYHLYRIEENGSATELLSDIFIPKAGEEYGLSPNFFAVNSSGQILISSYQEAFLYKSDGTRLNIFPQSFSGNIDFQTMAFTDQEYITVGEHELLRYSLSSGAVLENIPLNFLNGATVDSLGAIFTDQSGGIYIASEAGLSHRSKNGTIWETVIDGSLTSLAVKSLYLNSFTEGIQSDYYGVFVGELSEGIRLFHYTYDPDMAAVPPLVLSVYALKDNPSVRQAASIFQKENPEFRVEFRVALQDGNDSIKDDIIRALNTELLNGKGADVLLLDGLPLDSYEKKGVLLDIRNLFADINQDVPFLDIIPKHFMNGDGSVYYMPARITFPVIFGEEEAVNAFDSLSSMRAFKGEKQLFQMGSYENLLRIVASLHYSELFGKDIENLTPEMLTDYLETVRKLGAGSELTLDGEWAPSKIASNRPSISLSGGLEKDLDFDKGITACSLNEFGSIFSTLIPWAIQEKQPGTDFRTVNGVYFPKLLTGINQASVQKEAAAKFLKILYSMEVQSIEFNDGFPVLKEALDSWADIDKEISLAITNEEGYELSALWPDRERREKVIHLVDTLKEAVWMDETVMEMIIDGSREYFNGTQTAEQAANAISRKIRLYLAE